MPEPTARAVVSDDGSTIWLTAYTEAGDADALDGGLLRVLADVEAVIAGLDPDGPAP